ncbi:MAG TPA: indolepyruvate decarboxylase, partial [Mycobacterium sp.]
WRWRDIPAALGIRNPLSHRATTCGELDAALADAAAHPNDLVFIEAVVTALDVPPLLEELAEAIAKANEAT